VVITVNPVNDAPVAVDDSATTDSNVDVTIDVQDNDNDPDNDPLTTTVIAQPTNGTATVVNGDSITYSPNPNFYGQDTLTYSVCDAGGLCDTAEVVISVLGGAVPCSIDLALWLEGSYEPTGDTMRTDLNNQGLLPGQDPTFFIGTETAAGQPYNVAPWNYNGTEGDAFDYNTVGDGKAGYSADVVDWVLVSLRANTMDSSTICTEAALLMKDGTVTFPGGCNCPMNLGQEVYIVIEHRNHLPIMTPTPVTVTATGVAFDFRDKQSYKTFLDDGQKEVEPGVYVMFGANGDQTGAVGSRGDINPNDETIWINNTSVGDTYHIGDYNMDGDVNANDESLWLENNNKASDVNFE
jgi:hypothetical protein